MKLTIMILMGFGMIFLLNGCSYKFKSVVVAHNNNDPQICLSSSDMGMNSMTVIDVVKDTPEARKVLISKLRKYLKSEYENQLKTKIKWKTVTETVDVCSVYSAATQRYICEVRYDKTGENRERERIKKIWVSGINYYGKEKHFDNDDILFAYRIDTECWTDHWTMIYVRTDGKNLIINRTGNYCSSGNKLNTDIEKIISDSKEIQSLHLKYYQISSDARYPD